MTDQDKPNEGSLVGGGRRDLAPVAAANPLVSRGIADLAQGRLANVIVPSYLDHRDSLFYYQRMILWDGLDREKKLIEDLNEAIRLDPQNGLLYSKRGSASSGRADHNKAIRDFDKAIQLFDEAIRLHPNNAVAYLHRGNAWLAKEEA